MSPQRHPTHTLLQVERVQYSPRPSHLHHNFRVLVALMTISSYGSDVPISSVVAKEVITKR